MHSHRTAQSYTLVHFTNAQFTSTTTATIPCVRQSICICAYWHSVLAFVTDVIASITMLTVHAHVDSTALYLLINLNTVAPPTLPLLRLNGKYNY
jgi:hypothetical protein